MVSDIGATIVVIVLFALLATEWAQTAKDAIDTILFKCKNEVQADLARHTQVTSLDYMIPWSIKTVKESDCMLLAVMTFSSTRDDSFLYTCCRCEKFKSGPRCKHFTVWTQPEFGAPRY